MATCSRCGDSDNDTVIVHRTAEDPRYMCLLCVADEIVEAETEHHRRTGKPPKLSGTEATTA